APINLQGHSAGCGHGTFSGEVVAEPCVPQQRTGRMHDHEAWRDQLPGAAVVFTRVGEHAHVCELNAATVERVEPHAGGGAYRVAGVWRCAGGDSVRTANGKRRGRSRRRSRLSECGGYSACKHGERKGRFAYEPACHAVSFFALVRFPYLIASL